MGQVHPLPKTTTHDDSPASNAAEATVSRLEHRCALCGEKLDGLALRRQVVSPQSAHKAITVCHLCGRAALGEGYRPAE